MRQRIWRRLFAAAVCVIAAAGVASAQQPVVVAQPAPGATAPTVAAPGPYVAAPPPVPYSVAGPNCNGIAGGYFMSGNPTPTRLGSGCNQCGSARQDASFIFGPCASFFAPCGGLSSGGLLGGKCGHGGKCGGGLGSYTTPVYGTGGRPFNTCCYDSYANH